MQKYIFFIAVFVIAIFIYPAFSLITSPYSQGEIVSPLPKFLTDIFPQPFREVYAWKPKEQIYPGSITKPQVFSSGALIYDITTERLLYANDIKKRLPIASLTKIMTAVVAVENNDLTKKIKIEKEAATIGEDSMGLSEGEVLELKDLLHGLFLNSGNDAAEAIASSSQFGRDNFIYLMNKKVEELGLTDTHFTNPSGLQGDGEQYSTAYDLLVITKYALENKIISQIASTVSYEIAQTASHKAYSLFNETNLLTSYPGVKGVKTGYTYEAGFCLISYLDYQGHEIIGILLNADNRRQSMKDLLDYSLKIEGVTPPPHS